jgi:hypothetical protein
MTLLSKEENKDIIKALIIYDTSIVSAPYSIQTPYNALQNPIIQFQFPPFPVYINTLQITWDSAFSSNFKYKLEITGIADLSTVDFKTPNGQGIKIAEGKKVLIPPSAWVKVYAYNTNSSNTTNGSVNLYIEAEPVEQ